MTETTSSDPSVLAGLPCNLRDLGGLPTVTGDAVRPRVLYRSDDLAPAGRDRVRGLVADLDLAVVIDLRSEEELARLGRGGLERTPARIEHLPLALTRRAVGSASEPIEDLPTTPRELGDFYARAVESAAPLLAQGLELLASSPGPALFHCVAGKDRTGLLAALALSAADVTREAVVEDYAGTQANMPVLLEQHRLGRGVADDERAEQIASLPAVLLEAPAEAMRICLTGIERRHGHVLAPLYRVGLRGGTVAALRARLVGGR